ncbi:hypothetical protein RUM44_011587 [Polyplax serrata]|uniref:Uncharacterized protein n=1 Tax=Polyplax serrata TaxID=468196 RepID=A0ABR1AQI1_POLSC
MTDKKPSSKYHYKNTMPLTLRQKLSLPVVGLVLFSFCSLTGLIVVTNWDLPNLRDDKLEKQAMELIKLREDQKKEMEYEKL